jgi:hypothetical protein
MQDTALDPCPPSTATRQAYMTRLVLPLLLPLLSIAAVAVLVLNLSRVFLAHDQDTALVIAIVITLGILTGAATLAAIEHLRTTSLAMVLSSVAVVLVAAGLVTLGPSLDDGESAASTSPVDPPGQPIATVDVTAGPRYTFDGVPFRKDYTSPAGIVRLNYQGDGGHTLAIDDPRYSDFLLGTDASARHTQKVLLTPGTYTIYCTVTGHEGLGMKGTITVTAK